MIALNGLQLMGKGERRQNNQQHTKKPSFKEKAGY